MMTKLKCAMSIHSMVNIESWLQDSAKRKGNRSNPNDLSTNIQPSKDASLPT